MQNFQPEPGTPMAGSPPADPGRFARAAALARVAMPEMNIQAPPNLSPGRCAGLLGAGINDWGGISPVTPDHVNPAFPWPAIGAVEEMCAGAGLELKCRFPVYPEFSGMAGSMVSGMMEADADDHGHVREGRWR